MKSIYDYNENITITKTPRGDVVMTMNEEILTVIMNRIHDAAQFQKERGFEATAEDTMEIWKAIVDKEGD